MHTITVPAGSPGIAAEMSGSADRAAHGRFTRGEWLMLCALALVAVAVYANSLWNGFAFDDDWIILRNPRVHQLQDLGLIWGTPYWPTYGTELGLYRPLAIFAYALEWAAADGQPWVFHAVNVALHSLVTVLVFLLLRTMVKSLPAALGSLVFAVHPVHTEVVANGVGQAELLAAAGMLAACLIHATRPRDSARVSWPRIIVTVSLYFASLFAKEAAITLPALLILLDVVQERVTLHRARLSNYLRSVWMLFFLMAAAAIMYLAVRTDVLGSISGLDAGPGLPFLREEHRILSAFRAWPEFVRLLFFPKDLSADYAPAVILPVESLTPMAILGLLILAGTIAIALLTPRYPKAGFPAAWFFITILTVSNLLFPIGVVVAERTLYTPSVAVAAIVAFAWQALQEEWPAQKQRLALAVLILAVGLMSIRTVVRNRDWRNTMSVLNAISRDHPEASRTAWTMATYYWQMGNLGLSEFYWEAALRLWPRDSHLMVEVANFQVARRNWGRAIELLEKARDMHPWVWRSHELLAFSYVHTNRPTEAIAASNEAFKLGGTRSVLLAIKALAYEQLGQKSTAVGAWRVATAMPRGDVWVYQAMKARALARFGDRPAALAAAESIARAHARDSLVAPILAELRSAIQNECFGASPAPDCSDPLAQLTLTGEPLMPQKVTDSKNVPPSNRPPTPPKPPVQAP